MPTLYSLDSPGIKYHHSRDRSPDPARFLMHAHDGYELYFFVSGQVVYRVESTAYRLQPGNILLMRPGEVHTPEFHSESPYERIVIQFREQELPTELPFGQQLLTAFADYPLGTGNEYPADTLDGQYLHAIFAHIERTPDKAAGLAALRAAMPAILSELYGSFCRRADSREEAGEPSRIRDILRYVNTHLYEELSLDDLCRRFFISKTQLGRLFRAATGSTVWDYILVKRLIEARRRLLAGTPITKAAADCGFRDYSAFFRAYCKRYGVSPAADRDTYCN